MIMEGTHHIAVVDDEPDLREGVATYLRGHGFAVSEADGGEALRALMAERAVDLVILDVNMPGEDGLSIARRLRAAGPVGILMLTANTDLVDRVTGLEVGADDYLGKPFELRELLARVRALLRRSAADAPGDVLRFADLVLHTGERSVRRGERAIELTRTEFALLELFLRHPRQVLTRSQIFERVWGYDFGPASNSLEVYVGYLRRKLEAAGEPRLIQTVRGVGYVLRDP